MKKVFLKSIALMMVLTLLGCQGAANTVDTESEQTQATVAQSIVETETLESESTINIPVSTKTIAEMVQAPEKMVYEFENPEVTESIYGEVGVNANIMIPDADSMSVVPIIKKNITEENVKILYDQVMSENAVWISQELIEGLIARAEEKIMQVDVSYAENKGNAKVDQWYEENTWAYETIIDLLGQLKDTDAPDYSIKTVKNTQGEDVDCALLLAIDGDYIKYIWVVNESVQYCSFMTNINDYLKTVMTGVRGHLLEFASPAYTYLNDDRMTSYGYSDCINDDLLLDMSRQETTDLFNSLLEQSGFDNYEVDYTVRTGEEDNPLVTNPADKEDYLANLSFEMHGRNYYNGISIFGGGTHDYLSGNAVGRKASTGWNYLFIEPTWEYDAPLVEGVELLPFERIETIIKDLIDKDLNDDEIDTVLTREPLTDIRLEYSLVHDEEMNKDILIPVWNCYRGALRSEFGEDTVEEGAYYYNEYVNMLTINAIDGSIIYIDQKTLTDTLEVPEHMNYTLYNENDEAYFKIDAEIVVPDTLSMDVVSFEVETIETEDIPQRVETILPEGYTLWNDILINQAIEDLESLEFELIVSQLEEQALEQKRSELGIETERETFERDDEDYSNYTENISFMRMLLMSEEGTQIPGFRSMQIRTAKDKKETVHIAFFNKELTMGFVMICKDRLLMMGEDYTVKETIQLALNLVDTWVSQNMELSDHLVDYTIPESVESGYDLSKIASEEALNQEILRSLNYLDYQRIYYNPTAYLQKLYADFHGFGYSKTYDDIYILGKGNNDYDEFNSIILATHNDEVYTLMTTPSISLGEVREESVELIPFWQLENIIDYHAKSENFVAEFGPIPGTIESIRLEYITIFDETGEGGSIVPAWNFYYATPATDEKDNLLYKENRLWLSVNAMDGTIIR